MKRDFCSQKAYHEILKDNYVSSHQAMYLSVFMRGDPMTHRDAILAIGVQFHKFPPQRNSRISELEAMGFLEKDKPVTCYITHKKVNTWLWTGRREPLPKKLEKVPCSCCDGKGFTFKEVYSSGQPKQQELFKSFNS